MRRSFIVMGMFTLAVLNSCVKELKQDANVDNTNAPSAASTTNAITESAGDFVPDELLVKFKKGASESNKDKAFKNFNGKVKEKVLTKAMEKYGDNGFYLVNTTLDVSEAIKKAKESPDVEYAEPNYIYTHEEI